MWTYPRIVAHRGGGVLAPENTMAALRCARAFGFAAVEFDVMLAADGIPVLVHDACLGRTVRGAGQVAGYRAAELAAMDAGSWFSPDFAGEGVPALHQALRFCLQHHIWMNIEIKPASGQDVRTGRIVASEVRAFWRANNAATLRGDGQRMPLLSSFSLEALIAARDSAPEVARALLVDAVPKNWQDRMAQCEAIALHVQHSQLDADTAEAIRQAGYGLLGYTVNDPAQAAILLGWGVDALCTDNLAVIGPAFAGS